MSPSPITMILRHQHQKMAPRCQIWVALGGYIWVIVMINKTGVPDGLTVPTDLLLESQSNLFHTLANDKTDCTSLFRESRHYIRVIMMHTIQGGTWDMAAQDFKGQRAMLTSHAEAPFGLEPSEYGINFCLQLNDASVSILMFISGTISSCVTYGWFRHKESLFVSQARSAKQAQLEGLQGRGSADIII